MGNTCRPISWGIVCLMVASAALAAEDPFDPVPGSAAPPRPQDGTFGLVVNMTAYPGGPIPLESVNGAAYDASSNALWLTDPRAGRLVQVDRASKTILASHPLADGVPSDAAWDGSTVWYSDYVRNEIIRVDPATGSVLESFAPPGPAGRTEGLTWDGVSLWMGNAGDGMLYRTDPSGTVLGSCAAPAAAGGADGLAFDAGNGFLLLVGYNRALYRLDPATCAVLAGPAPLSRPNNGLAFDGFLGWDGQNELRSLRELDVDTPTDSAGIPLPIVSEEAAGSVTAERRGSSVASAGDLNPGPQDQGLNDFIVGSPGFEDPASGVPAGAGAALVYLGADNTTDRTTPDIIFTGVAAHDRTGTAVAGNFDFNGDGVLDLLIGAEQVDRTGPTPQPTGAGKVYLIYFDPTDSTHYPNLGDPTVADTVSLALVGQPGGIPGVQFTGVALGDQAGFSVTGGGRVDSGAGQDIAIGAPGADTVHGADSGRVYVIFDDPALSGTVSLADVADTVDGVVYEGADAGGALGFSVAFPGDVVEPAGDDIAMGAPLADPTAGPADATLPDAGATYLPPGGTLSAGIIETCDIGGDCGGGNSVGGARIVGHQAGMQSGYAVAGGGDNLQNGETDLLIGAPLFDTVSAADQSVLDAGGAFQVGGRLRAGIIETCDIGGDCGGSDIGPVDGVQYHGDEAGGHLGSSVGGVGDATASGGDDIALGAPLTDPQGLVDAGTVFVVEETGGSGFGGIIQAADIGVNTSGRQLNGVQSGEQAGSSIAGTGDVSADANEDFVAGSPGKDQTGGVDAGAVWLVLESPKLSAGQNGPPIADASATLTPAECDGDLQGTVWLDGSRSSDPDSTPGTNDDIVAFEWFEGQSFLDSGETASVVFDLGAHDVTLKVTDTFNAWDTDTVTVEVRDTLSPTGAITMPAAGSCHGPGSLPVVVAAGFADICDPSIVTAYDPPPGPSYDSHGDHVVSVTATDSSGNVGGDSVAFTVDTVPPVVTVISPPDGIEIGQGLPFDVVFDATDDDLASGDVVQEQVFLDDCLVYDGLTYGNGDGLLRDETLVVSEAELCRIIEHCGFSSLVQPVLRVEATDCGGNLGADAVQFSGELATNPGVCVPIDTKILGAAATVADWDEHAGVLHYDVVRGDVANLSLRASAGSAHIDLGPLTCVENDSVDTTTAGNEDPYVPDPGQVLFYVIRSYDGRVETSYGRSSLGFERWGDAGTGDCH